jgi:FkbM family methyltransferase
VLIDQLRRTAGRGVKLARILRRPEYRRALRHGVAAAVEHERVGLPSELKTVLDVGANRGQFALVALRRWPDARLVCFEPLDTARRQLTEVVGGSGAEIRDVALAEQAGEVEFHVSRADDSSSLLPITPRQAAMFPGTDEVRTMPVRTARLDVELAGEPLAGPVLLKIDVQGGELGVLRGAVGLLDQIDVIMVECSFVEFYAGQPLAHELIEFLAAHEFVLTSAGSPTMDGQGRVVQLDFVFSRRP